MILDFVFLGVDPSFLSREDLVLSTLFSVILLEVLKGDILILPHYGKGLEVGS